MPDLVTRAAAVRFVSWWLVLSVCAIILRFPPVVPHDGHVTAEAVALFRIGFGLILLHRLVRLKSAVSFLWPRTRRWKLDAALPLSRVLALWTICAVCLIVGAATPVAALGSYGLGLYVFGRSRIYSIEDMLFQLFSFFLVWLDSGRVVSVDSLLGWRLVAGIDTVVSLNLFWLTLALLMFSAGFEKLWSPIWRRGQGFNAFVGLPHLVQPRFRFLRAWPRLGRILSWMSVVAELSLLPSALWWPARVTVTVLLLGFSIGLLSIVDFSFIGQVLSAGLLLFLFLDVSAAIHGGDVNAFAWRSADSLPMPWIIVAAIGVSLVSLVGFHMGRLPRLSRLCTRWTVGLMPVRVFTDRHLFGIYLFRIVGHHRNGEEDVFLPVFEADGGPGPFQRWYPRVFHSLMYPISDICLLAQRGGCAMAETSSKFETIVDCITGAVAGRPASQRDRIERIVLYVRAVDGDVTRMNSAPRFVMSDWTALLEFRLEGGHVRTPRWIGMPPAVRGSARLSYV